jgi:uncharacterized membrane protein
MVVHPRPEVEMRKARVIGLALVVAMLAAFAAAPKSLAAAVCFGCTNEDCASGPGDTCQCTAAVLTTCYYRGLPFANESCTAKGEQ